MLKLGICADIHGDTERFSAFIGMLPEDVDAIVIVGDIPSNKDPLGSMKTIFAQALKPQIPVYVVAGNYENKTEYAKAIAAQKSSLLIDTTLPENHFAKVKDVSLCFISGANVLASKASFLLVPDKAHAQLAMRKKKGLSPVLLTEFDRLLTQDTVVFCHCAPYMRGSLGLDYATYGKALEDFTFDVELADEKKKVEYSADDTIYNLFGLAEELSELGAPISLHKSHVGPKFLSQFLRRKKVRFFVCGHIHEMGGTAVSRLGSSLKENTWHKELFYNVGAVMDGHAAILECSGSTVKYRKLSL